MDMSLLGQGKQALWCLVKTSSRIPSTFRPFLPIFTSYTEASAEDVSVWGCNDTNNVLFAATSHKQPFRCDLAMSFNESFMVGRDSL